MAKKLLIAGGCSYTDPNYLTNDKNLPQIRGAWKMWPEHISERLDLEYMNVGESGSDNQTIYNNLLEAILTYEDRIDTVVVLWTGWDRFLFMHEYPICFAHIFGEIVTKENPNLGDFYDKTELHEVFKKIINNYKMFSPTKQLTKQIRNSLFLMYSLAKICESKNIKYIFAQGVSPPLNREWDFWIKQLENQETAGQLTQNLKDSFHMGKAFLKTPIFPHLEKRKKNIIGWPFVSDLRGYTMDDDRHGFNNHFRVGFPDNRYHVSELDRHPNEEGQEIISRYFIERYGELYGLYN